MLFEGELAAAMVRFFGMCMPDAPEGGKKISLFACDAFQSAFSCLPLSTWPDAAPWCSKEDCLGLERTSTAAAAKGGGRGAEALPWFARTQAMSKGLWKQRAFARLSEAKTKKL